MDSPHNGAVMWKRRAYVNPRCPLCNNNHLHAELLLGDINVHLNSMLFRETELTQVLKALLVNDPFILLC